MNTKSQRVPFPVLILSVLATPTFIFFWTANHNYLANQADFGYDSSVLLPYLWLAIATVVMGLLLGWLSVRPPIYLLLWLYYLAGPFYFFYRVAGKVYWEMEKKSLGDFADNAVFLVLVLLLAALIYVLFKKKVPLLGLARMLALLGPLLVVSEIYNYFSRVESLKSATSLAAKLDLDSITDPATNGPNIYHLILDGFQTDMFEVMYPQDVREKELGGMWYFPDNITNYGRTRFSIPAVFLGRGYDIKTPQLEFFRSPFESEESFLYKLRQSGYKTFGFQVAPRVMGATEALFDYSVRHIDHVSLRNSANQKIFRQLWAVSNFPEILYRNFVSRNDSQAMLSQQVLSPLNQAMSYRAFEKIMELESELPARGRYTFIHLMIPHPPLTLDSNCRSNPPDVSESNAYLGQIECANKIIRDFVARLKALDRYDQSMIVIHGDHGFYAGLRDGKLVSLEKGAEVHPDTLESHTDEFARARSRALLLIKPPGTEVSTTGMVTSRFPSMLTDVAPTILQASGVAPGVSGLQPSLLIEGSISDQRERYYHFYDFVTTADGIRQTANRMFRWRIESDAAIPEGFIVNCCL